MKTSLLVGYRRVMEEPFLGRDYGLFDGCEGLGAVDERIGFGPRVFGRCREYRAAIDLHVERLGLPGLDGVRTGSSDDVFRLFGARTYPSTEAGDLGDSHRRTQSSRLSARGLVAHGAGKNGSGGVGGLDLVGLDPQCHAPKMVVDRAGAVDDDLAGHQAVYVADWKMSTRKVKSTT